MTNLWDRAFDLTGRVALVTGGAAGIGHACAQLLAQRGASVALVDRHPETMRIAATLAGGAARHVGMSLDLRDCSAAQAAVELVASRFGGVDMLVNSAGVALLDKALDVGEAAWDATMAINVKASFFVAQAVARQMIAGGGGGRIVNLASQASVVGLDRHVAYCASKAAIVGMTKVLALEWAPHGITVNAVSPTIVETELGKKAWAGEAGERAKREIPAGRFAQPDEIAALVLYLLSDAAAMMTGENVVIDGGYTVR
ncbi:SDR family oxidoreductase [Burkholderia oklahomensis]|uniref:SDR family oxidoreductase n=1 Tax=Burkholderia oklahomensis TaxID=342113 RepID=UPI00016A6DF1|nr:D-threitol dehydrogenase [Burkholderia oklahomensis]AJX34340.1 short chain dehydrogenase family protein [Burkholderia oklahomensis C6786]AOI49808.1 short-chain dehydrogenase [Burkholderia oklahomensis C6786]KUY47318.1 short-chain dehydrogenase [Burkholderia oklahomensis C6786]MBI0361885.1 D-threitol dehydrogenase [Burkholderia oklahomensis]SUY28835.1 2-dehydro-3-deoxy-D-gluconate 5-dehydrogenase [Burkholderia oklahomensis]